MKRTRLGVTALALVLGLGLMSVGPVNSQDVVDQVSEVADGPEFMVSEQVAEMPGGDTFAMRMRHGGSDGSFGGGMAMGASCPYLEGENKLSDEQFEKFYQIKNRMKDDMGNKMIEMSKLRRQFCDEINRESIDAKAISKLEDRMAALKGETSKVFTSAAVEMMNVLTPEQRKILRQKMVRGSSMGSSMGHCGMGMGHCEMGMGRGPGMMMHSPRLRHHKGGDK
jgi:Spy/CpxP family protein refolding chaperone